MGISTGEISQALSGTPAVVTGIVLLAIGLMECFFGFKAFRIQVGIICFLGGLAIGYGAFFSLFGNWVPALVAGAVLGVVLCVLSLAIFRVGVFLFVGFLTFGLTSLWVYGRWAHGFWVALGIAVVVGLIGAFLAKPFIILSTAFSGGGMAVHGVLALLGRFGTATWVSIVGGIVSIVLAVLGAVYQFRQNRNAPLPTRGGLPRR